jgi:methyltransferase (TIGR00027 family)
MRDDAPSQTARGVAAHRLDYERLQAPYGDPAADEALTRDVADGLVRLPGSPRHEYLRARTAFFDRVVVNSLDHRVRQVVLGAAGYDGRAFRYAKPGVRWFEVDHPATQADKLARIARLGLDTSNITFVAADFAADPVADLLTAAGLDTSRAALFLLEGVAVYLEQPVLERVLGEFRAVTVPGGLLAISVSSGNAQSADRERFQAAVAAVGEPVRSALSAAAARELLAGVGWQVPEEGRDRLRSAGLLLARAAASPDHPERTPPTPDRPRSAPGVSPPSPVTGRLPLSALLSHALVAFTIEADNEAEHRLPHTTQDYGRSAGAGAVAPWLTSLVMWANCLRYVPDDGITLAAMRAAARTGTNVDGMRRWGYVTYTPDPGRGKRPRPDAIVRLKPGGQRARQVWDGVPAQIEQRWRDRFGAPAVDGLRAALAAVVADLDPRLPDCLPILHPGLFSEPDLPDAPSATAAPAHPTSTTTPTATPDSALPLWALLSRTLLAFATEFEDDSGRSLAISANLLRVLTEDGVRSRDVPALAGISKAAVAFTMGPATKQGLVVEEPDPAGSRWKITRLTSSGARAQRAYAGLTGAVEDRWRSRFGAARVAALRDALEPLAVGDPPPLFGGLTPYPDGWRAQVKPPSVLPHYPMVLHRGGYPDGA